MITALLADDEEHALSLLELLLHQTGEVKVIGRCGNGIDAIAQIARLKPDVAFLDIEMPGMNGLEVAERLGSTPSDTQVVFVTAYDRYAVSAFENDALDYLLKPLEVDRLNRTVGRVKRAVARRKSEALDPADAGKAAAEKPPAELQVQLLGEIQVSVEGRGRLKWRTSKEKELFAYLAVHYGSRIHRDVLLDELWPDEHYQKAKVYLHTCVSYLRRDFRQLGMEDAVIYEDEKYSLAPRLERSDYREFVDAAAGLLQPGGSNAEQLERTVNLYSGRLFRSEDYQWADDEIRHTEAAIEAQLLRLTQLYEEQRDYGRMIAAGRRLLQHSPYNEEAYRILMKAYAGSGKHDEVYRVYEEMERRLDELQIQASDMTLSLYEGLRVRKRG
ncbi:pentatricopeptide repeat domain-containing protein (PPR motif) [Cohnella sp. OV330]|uniref:response regulator n=1 Tax=Cohnella sp. OV330 TaxID=1855288 RepID=UPI0008E27BF6|nr:response regulator [Cohnella sp. OV330]SFB46503.1 pentatricopeptide repeat domain-containing protein (PPR motif) [Cohnella sp. OV330]